MTSSHRRGGQRRVNWRSLTTSTLPLQAPETPLFAPFAREWELDLCQ